jgi:hypothetical protein
MATGAVLSKGIEPGRQQYSDAEIKAAVDEATRWGGQVAAHAHGAAGIKAAIRAGVRTVDHGSDLDDEAIALIKASKAKRITCSRLSRFDRAERIKNNAGVERERSRKMQGIMFAGFKRAAANFQPGSERTRPSSSTASNQGVCRPSQAGELPAASIVSATSLNATDYRLADRGQRLSGKIRRPHRGPGRSPQDITCSGALVVMKGGVFIGMNSRGETPNESIPLTRVHLFPRSGRTWRLAAPVAFVQVGVMTMGVVDIVMVGHYRAWLAAVALATFIFRNHLRWGVTGFDPN